MGEEMGIGEWGRWWMVVDRDISQRAGRQAGRQTCIRPGEMSLDVLTKLPPNIHITSLRRYTHTSEKKNLSNKSSLFKAFHFNRIDVLFVSSSLFLPPLVYNILR